LIGWLVGLLVGWLLRSTGLPADWQRHYKTNNQDHSQPALTSQQGTKNNRSMARSLYG